MGTERRKLIEVALPLEAINKEAAREKSIRHGHPSTLHLWWARRPLAAARAVLFAQLVDDPASRPEAEAIDDPDEREAWIAAERTRLFRLIEELVQWENSTNERVLAAARAEILRSTDGNPPPILDPFAGGGTIPLEAQRLGLEARASDLNPVAVLINKALIEIPPKFAGRPPVFPGAANAELGDWPRATGLAEDVRRYGAWMRDEAEKRIGRLYPMATLPDGTEATVIAWIWARTVACPNPACGIRMPLVRSWWLSKKKGNLAYVMPEVTGDGVRYRIGREAKSAPAANDMGTVGRAGAMCVGCGAAVDLDYIRSEGQAGGLAADLMAVVTEARRGRQYLLPDALQLRCSDVAPPTGAPIGDLAFMPRDIKAPIYGMSKVSSLFTNRQLVALTTFSQLVLEAHVRIRRDADSTGAAQPEEYSAAVVTYLALALSKMTNINSSITTWMSDRGAFRETFARQAIPMTWDFAEANLLGSAGGGWSIIIDKCAQVIRTVPAENPGAVRQWDAAEIDFQGSAVSMDPPYYDNIEYADLSDYFYVWLRLMLREVFPDLFATLVTPKAQELVANPYRHDGKANANAFFESGFRRVLSRARRGCSSSQPLTVFYAFKQSESDSEGESSTGWAAFLTGVLGAGWRVTGTWPMRTEGSGRLLATGKNALASSIVLALRPRGAEAPVVDRRAFTAELREVLPGKLRELQQGSIAGVDLPQAAIGPGMAVFSQYGKVVESDGSPMAVGSALQVINQVLGEVLWRQEGDFDAPTRWCVKWFETYGFDPGPYGEAETFASAFNTSVKTLGHCGALTAGGSKVQLFAPEKLPAGYDPRTDDRVALWEVVLHLAKALDESGLDAAGLLFARAAGRVDLDAAKELAYLLFAIANDDRRRWSAIAGLFNVLVASWSDVVDAARRASKDSSEQLALDTTY